MKPSLNFCRKHIRYLEGVKEKHLSQMKEEKILWRAPISYYFIPSLSLRLTALWIRKWFENTGKIWSIVFLMNLTLDVFIQNTNNLWSNVCQNCLPYTKRKYICENLCPVSCYIPKPRSWSHPSCLATKPIALST